MRLLILLTTICLGTTASTQFVGMGSRFNWPFCCVACRNSISAATLLCTPHMDHSHGHGHGTSATSPDCYAKDDAFLTTLAYCISERCGEYSMPIWEREKYWADSATGSPAVQAKWTYQEALQQVSTKPNDTYVRGNPLNQTLLVAYYAWDVQRTQSRVLDSVSARGNKYIHYRIRLPDSYHCHWQTTLMTGVHDKLKPYLVYPSTFGTYQVRPLPGFLGNAPTIGQALYIIGFFVLNIVLTFIGYESVAPLPHPWGYKSGPEWLAYAGYRTGDLAFALLPLTILFAGRNNILLWATNWSHATYLLLHRWVARIFVFQTLLHSVFLLVAYIRNGIFASNKNQPYWVWGIVGTVAACAMPVFSALFFRRLSYEMFLLYHIISAVFVIVGSWYHLIYRFGLTNSHEYWLYAACAVWFFDRLLRVLRTAKNGIRRAVVTDIGDGHVRVDVQGLRWAAKPGYHAYAYFPTVNALRPWENHPFSVNTTSLFSNPSSSPISLLKRSTSDNHDVEKTSGQSSERQVIIPIMNTTSGISFIVRKNHGMTKHLRSHASLITLIDGPYRNNTSDSVLKCDRVLLIGGGIGITGLLSWTNAHSNVKLAWSLKESSSAVLKEVEGALSRVADTEVVVGQRLDVDALLRSEVSAGYQRVGIVVCGPGGLCDDVRARVASLGGHEKTVFDLEVHAYSW